MKPFLSFRFHDLRHQAITEMAENGVADATLKAIAGHMSNEMMEHYSHVRMAKKKTAVAFLGGGCMILPIEKPSGHGIKKLRHRGPALSARLSGANNK